MLYEGNLDTVDIPAMEAWCRSADVQVPTSCPRATAHRAAECVIHGGDRPCRSFGRWEPPHIRDQCHEEEPCRGGRFGATKAFLTSVATRRLGSRSVRISHARRGIHVRAPGEIRGAERATHLAVQHQQFPYQGSGEIMPVCTSDCTWK
jgi:hypothetical protein